MRTWEHVSSNFGNFGKIRLKTLGILELLILNFPELITFLQSFPCFPESTIPYLWFYQVLHWVFQSFLKFSHVFLTYPAFIIEYSRIFQLHQVFRNFLVFASCKYKPDNHVFSFVISWKKKKTELKIFEWMGLFLINK